MVDPWAKLFLLVIPICLIIGVVIGGMVTDHNWRLDAVRHGVAHYDTTTGVWQWNEKAAHEERP